MNPNPVTSKRIRMPTKIYNNSGVEYSFDTEVI